MKKIVVAQFYTANVGHGFYAEKINEKYCNEKGYIYFCEKDTTKINQGLDNRAPTWYKPKLVKEVLETYNPDYVLFLDIDAIVSDSSQSIEDFIDENYDFILAEDVGDHSLGNAGVLLFKNSEWTKKFLNDWWESAEVFTGGDSTNLVILEQNLDRVGYFKHALWHDQTCFTILYNRNEDYKNHIKVIENTSFNYREYNRGNFIFHAFAYGWIKNRTLDLIYYKLFDIEKIPSSSDLTDLAKLYHTDKQYEHNYFDLIYNNLFVPIKNDVKNFLEIGVASGQSMLLWRDFFINAQVYGADISIDYTLSNLVNSNKERLHFVKLDQSLETDLENFANENEDFDIIMDDGSHRMRDQQITFAKLFKNLKSGGIYILEDLHTSLEVVMPEKRVFDWGDPEKTITLNMLKGFMENKMIVSDYMSQEEVDYLNENIESVNIYQSRPDWSITSVIIKK